MKHRSSSEEGSCRDSPFTLLRGLLVKWETSSSLPVLSPTLFYEPAKCPLLASLVMTEVGARLIASWGGVTVRHVGPAPGAINLAPTPPPGRLLASLVQAFCGSTKKVSGRKPPIITCKDGVPGNLVIHQVDRVLLIGIISF